MNGPRELYLACLGETVLERLQALHCRRTPTDDGEIKAAMRAVFGMPELCLVCAAPLGWGTGRLPDDVDPWFCSNCCPVCLSDDELAV